MNLTLLPQRSDSSIPNVEPKGHEAFRPRLNTIIISIPQLIAHLSAVVLNGTKTEDVRVEKCLQSGLRQMRLLHRTLSVTVSSRQRDQLFADICREFSKDLSEKLSKLKLDQPLVQVVQEYVNVVLFQ